MGTTRRRFPEEFKREAVHLATQPGMTISGVARDLGLSPSVLRRWIDNARGGKWSSEPGKPLKSDMATELERTRRELAKVKMERDILKKALGYFAKDPT